jgi:hypothetical protein
VEQAAFKQYCAMFATTARGGGGRGAGGGGAARESGREPYAMQTLVDNVNQLKDLVGSWAWGKSIRGKTSSAPLVLRVQGREGRTLLPSSGAC